MENTENTTPSPKEGEFQCTHCMKCKPEGEGVKVGEDMFCCTDCHARGPIHTRVEAAEDGTTKPKNVCEFC